MLDWWFGSRLEGDQYEFVEEQGGEQYQEGNFVEGKCNKGPLLPMNFIIHTYACV